METETPRGRRQYRNPPIDEAVCEFHFLPGPDWDLTIPGKLQAALGSDYGGKPQHQQVVNLGLEFKPDEPSSLSYGQELSKVLLFRDDEKRAVGVGRDALSIHMLRPYQDPETPEKRGWDEFRPRIRTALETYWKVAEPRGVRRISIRYINRIVIPEPVVRIEDYLRCAAPSVQGLPEDVNSYMSRTDYLWEEGTRLVLAQGSILSESERIGFLLDINAYWETQAGVGQADAMARTDRLRDIEREAFENVITDAARELFDADPE